MIRPATSNLPSIVLWVAHVEVRREALDLRISLPQASTIAVHNNIAAVEYNVRSCTHGISTPEPLHSEKGH